MAESNRMYQEMRRAALERLAGRDVRDIEARARAPFRDGAFRLTTLGREVSVRYPGYEISPALGLWHNLILMHYLDLADGTPLAGRQIPFAAQKDGMVRGGGFDREAEKMIQSSLGRLDPEELRARCRALGGQFLPSNADLCVEFPFLPMYPVYLKIWFADDEFDASGRMFLDASAEHYLSVEDSVTVGSVILEHLGR